MTCCFFTFYYVYLVDDSIVFEGFLNGDFDCYFLLTSDSLCFLLEIETLLSLSGIICSPDIAKVPELSYAGGAGACFLANKAMMLQGSDSYF